MVVVGRADMAIGAAGSEPGTLSMVRHLCPEQKRRARAVFWFDLAFGRLAFLAGMLVPPESSDPSKDRPDVRGFVLER